MAANPIFDFERLRQGVVQEIDRSSRALERSESRQQTSSVRERDIDAEVASMVNAIRNARTQIAELTELVEKQHAIIEQKSGEIDTLIDAQAEAKRSYLDQVATAKRDVQESEAQARLLAGHNNQLKKHLDTLIEAIHDIDGKHDARSERNASVRYAQSA